MNVSQQVLERLDSKGWQKKQSGGALGPNCLTGALGWILFDDESVTTQVSFDVQDLWRSIITKHFPERLTDVGTTIVKFNDHPATTIADVCWVLEKASAIEDGHISASDHEALNSRSTMSLT